MKGSRFGTRWASHSMHIGILGARHRTREPEPPKEKRSVLVGPSSGGSYPRRLVVRAGSVARKLVFFPLKPCAPTTSFEGLLRRQPKLGLLTACRYIDLLLPNVSAAGSAEDTSLHYGISGAPKLSSLHTHLARVPYSWCARGERLFFVTPKDCPEGDKGAFLRFCRACESQLAGSTLPNRP
jgi:hypothetical protein